MFVVVWKRGWLGVIRENSERFGEVTTWWPEDMWAFCQASRNPWGGILLKYHTCSPGWCGSVSWASSYAPKGCWFNSRPRYVLWLWAWFLVGGTLRSQQIDDSLSHINVSLLLTSLPHSLKINKNF